jgi:DNA-binding response OmpR family regulator/anti-sigma regulatory factor (Ser/Thr protein kinase)
MRLRIQYTDIVDFTRDIVGPFAGMAKERHIALTFSSGFQASYVWFDRDKIEKVIFNLLSNAFKYTPDHTTIRVDLAETNNTVIIRITDQGIGIPKEKQESIFNRFENLIRKSSYAAMSSGIGLSLAKELTELHQGSITVESEEGAGSAFTVTLPKDKTLFPADTEYIVGDSEIEHKSEFFPNVSEVVEAEDNRQDNLMLIVEDNHELRAFIKQVFHRKFRIIEARDGKEGLEKAFTFLPDIIITDIMMPEKDGIEMLQELRDDERTSQILAIVLTAKSDMDHILIGIQTGADDYITKPFSIRYLQSKVDGLLAQRKKLQAFYSQNKIESAAAATKEDTLQLSEKDRAFLTRLNKVMEDQMANPDLNVDYIVGCFNLSRTNFFHKLKSLTGLSPVLYIRDARMKKAAELIKEKQYTMAEIAYQVGFNDPHYFSKTFKAFWGMNATEYAKKICSIH